MKMTIIITILLLTACGGKEIVYKDRIVEVKTPVMVDYPEPPEFDDLDELPVDRIKKSDSLDAKTKAITATIEILKKMVKERDEALDVYRKKPVDK